MHLSPSLSLATAAGIGPSEASGPCASTSAADLLFHSMLKGQRGAGLMQTGGSLFGRAAECRITHICASNQFLSVSQVDVRSWRCSPIAQIEFDHSMMSESCRFQLKEVTRKPRDRFAISQQPRRDSLPNCSILSHAEKFHCA